MSFLSRFRREEPPEEFVFEDDPSLDDPIPFDAVLQDTLEPAAPQVDQPPAAMPDMADSLIEPLSALAPKPVEADETPFWDLYDRVASSAELFSVPATAISVVVGPLEAAIPVIRQSYQRHWGDACDIYVLTDRPFIPGQPDWNVVGSASDLVAVLEDGISHFPLLVLDVARELPVFVRPLIQRLRGAGVGMVRYVLDGDPTDEDLATWFGELGRPSVLDLATPVGTDRILDLLERGEPVVSVAGMTISAELLLAMKFDQGALA